MLYKALRDLNVKKVKAIIGEHGNLLLDEPSEETGEEKLIDYFLRMNNSSLPPGDKSKWKDIRNFFYFDLIDYENDIIKYALETLDLESLSSLLTKKTDLSSENITIFKEMGARLKTQTDKDKWNIINNFINSLPS